MNKYLTCAVVVVLCSSCLEFRLCQDKNDFLSGYADFTSDVGDHYQRFDSDDWKKIDREFQSYVDRCYPRYKDEMVLGEKLEFWKNTLAYGFYREKENNSKNDFLDELELDVSRELEELSAESRKELERLIKEELGDELERAIDDVVDGIQSIGEELKNWLNIE